jgi:sec-independent protein translocase protein TatB
MLPFGIGFGELVIIALVLLLVVGPKDLPKIAQEVGKNVRKARRMLAQIQDSAEVDEIKRAVYGEGPKPAWQRPEALMRPPVVVDAPPPPPPPTTSEPTETTAGATPAVVDAPVDETHENDDGAPVARLSGPAAAVARAEAEAVALAPPAPPPAAKVEP